MRSTVVVTSHAAIAAVTLAATALLFAACGVEAPREQRDVEIDALGDEAPGVPPGENHRPGQPCTLCHDALGPASSSPFVVGGTVYEGPPGTRVGAPDVLVRMRDSAESVRTVTTNCVGNFFVRADAWDPAFPLEVAIERPGPGASARPMQTHVAREGSCGACHRSVQSAGSPGPVVLSDAPPPPSPARCAP